MGCEYCDALISKCLTEKIARTCGNRTIRATDERDAAWDALDAHGITEGLPPVRAACVEARRRGPG
jgi:hypothetical protein